jgi:hypothetical protein
MSGHRKLRRRPLFLNRDERGGARVLGGQKPMRRNKRWIPDVGDELGHPDFAKSDVEMDIAGMGNKMRPRPRRRPLRRRKPLFIGRPLKMRSLSRRRRYRNFDGGTGSFVDNNKWLLVGGLALGFLFFTPTGKKLMAKMK